MKDPLTNRLAAIVAGLFVAVAVMAGVQKSPTYEMLWKEVRSAQVRDLPKTELDILGKIADKAEREKSFGNLLKAQLLSMKALYRISPDSLRPAVERMDTEQRASNERITKSVTLAVLSKIYAADTEIKDETKSREYADEAMKFPYLLAATEVEEFEPLAIEGYNSNVFDNDMLSLIGHELGQYEALYKYYSSKGNNRAACMAALYLVKNNYRDSKVYDIKKSPYVHALDSVLNIYSHLDVAGEVAIERYYGMVECGDVTMEDRIAYIHYAVEKWPSWQRMNELRNEERKLTAPTFNIKIGGNVVAPGKPTRIDISEARNINSITVRVTRLNANGDIELNPSSDGDMKLIRPLMDDMPADVKTLHHINNVPYQTFRDSLVLDPLPLGVYLVEAFTNPTTKVERTLYYVTDNYLLAEALPDSITRLVALSATTGRPIGGAKLRITISGDKTETIECDGNGEALYRSGSRQLKVYLYTDVDKYSPENRITGHFGFNDSDGKSSHTRVFTDRKIYRPGQTVHMAAILFANTSWVSSSAEVDKNVKALMRDADGTVVEEKELTTDSYGTCSADFVLPNTGQSGTYTIEVDGTSTYVKVEQYKRPSFKIEFPKISTRYQVGDTLSVWAKAVSYAGTPVQGASVHYKVWRRKALWWRNSLSSLSDEYEQLLVESSGITDGEGRFEVELPLAVPPEESGARIFYNFVVEADVSDISGETHSAALTIPLGTRNTAISSSLGDKELKDSLREVTIRLRNSAGIDVNTTAKIRIDDGRWYEGRTMIPMNIPKNLASGCHILTAIADSDTLVQRFIVFGLDDKIPCVDTDDWFYASSNSFNSADTPVTIQVGTSMDNVYLLYSIISGNKVLDSGATSLDNSIYNRKFRYKEEYGNGILLTYAWVKDGKCHTHSHKISRPKPDRKLKLKWTTFRDRLLPGQEETWTLSVTDSEGKAANAQLMATMYDASLDAIVKHGWTLHNENTIPLPNTKWTYPSKRSISLRATLPYSKMKYHTFGFSHFDEEVFPTYGKAETLLTARAAEVECSDEEVTLPATAEKIEEKSIRENIDETAFFYPSLHTNEKGETALSFTLPESLTSWRVIALAHTRDMAVGIIEDETIAQKEVMVQPYMPRFLRQHDKATISAKVFNTGNAKVKGTVRMEITNSTTGEILMEVEKPFETAVDKASVVSFDIDCEFEDSLFVRKESHPLLVCKVVAGGISESGSYFSDGEQHFLPILPCKETEKEEECMISGVVVDPRQMLDECLDNLSIPQSGNAIDQCASLYATTLSQHIKENTPSSNNDEKEIFNSRIESAIDKLEKLQNANGSWSWWQGMRGNNHITTYIIEMLCRLGYITRGEGGNSPYSFMLDKAQTYMDSEIVDIANRIREYKGLVGECALAYADVLSYLYSCCLSDHMPKGVFSEATTYLTELLKEEIKTQSIYDKATTATILNGRGETAKANEYVRSLKEYATQTDGMGIYYDTKRAEYSWRDYRIPTQVAVIEAIKTITPSDTATINGMLLWLIQEKMTQAWDTPINSVNAVYAFTTAGGNLDNPWIGTTASKLKCTDGLSIKREIVMPYGGLRVGSRIKVRITIAAARDFDFVEVVDGRAACMEPVEQLSGYKDGAYSAIKDYTTNYYFDTLSKGKHVVETEYYISRQGTYETGTCTATCSYAPRFRASTKSDRVVITDNNE